MKVSWRAALRVLLIVEGLICLSGCAGAPLGSPATRPNAGAATVAYALTFQSGPSGQIDEYSTAPADNGALVGTLILPTGYFAVQFATDLNGQLYVAACGPTAAGVFVYPPNSTGNATPSRTIEMGSCENIVSEMVAFAVDPSGQYLYVETPTPVDSPKTISVYPASANRALVPVRTLQLTTGWGDIAADANGNIFVTGSTSGFNGVINVYGPSATGTDAPVRTITFENEVPNGLAVDVNGNIFAMVAICCEGGDWAIEEFAPGAEGSASPTNTINLPPLPEGSNSGLVRLDASANIFASVLVARPTSNPPIATSVIYGFGPSATGNAAPTVTINNGQVMSLFALN